MTDEPTPDADARVTAAKKNAKRVIWLSMIVVIPVAIYFIFFSFSEGHNINGHGYTAHILTVVFAFISAFLFMGITFFSARSGHDDQPNYVDMAAKQRAKDQRAKDALSGQSDDR